MKRRLPLMCPSNRMAPGSTLLGVVGADGQLVYAPERIVVDEEFIRVANEGRDPRRRFRFSRKCHESGCNQWSEGRCSVADAVVDATAEVDGSDRLEAPLPTCSIRAECRWYHQRGAAACGVCPEVITTIYKDEPAASEE